MPNGSCTLAQERFSKERKKKKKTKQKTLSIVKKSWASKFLGISSLFFFFLAFWHHWHDVSIARDGVSLCFWKVPVKSYILLLVCQMPDSQEGFRGSKTSAKSLCCWLNGVLTIIIFKGFQWILVILCWRLFRTSFTCSPLFSRSCRYDIFCDLIPVLL